MINHGIIKVKEWFFDKVNDACKNYGRMLVGEYTDGMLDHTLLRIEELLAETEKAYKVNVDAETFGGNSVTWTCWIPKSVIEGIVLEVK